MKIAVNSLSDTKKLAQKFAKSLTSKGLFVTLTGDIGAGKTQFVRFVLEELRVGEKITSPSFVILNEYKCDLFPIYHFDLYRLEKQGLESVIPQLREYTNINRLTFIEWAEFAYDEIPKGALRINVVYDEDNLDVRYFEFDFSSCNNIDFISVFQKRIKE